MKYITSVCILLLSFFYGCTNNGIVMERPEDFTVTLEQRTGSIPPEYYYESKAIFAADSCSIEFYPGYTDDILFRKTFSVSQDRLDTLFLLMEKKKIFSTHFEEVENPPIGGGTSTLKIISNGETYLVPAFPKESDLVKPVYGYLANSVPAEIWAEWENVHQKYIEDYQKKQQEQSEE